MYCAGVDSWSTSRASRSAPRSSRYSATATVPAKWSGVWPSPPRALTSAGLAAMRERSRSIIPSRAAACASTIAPRSMAYAASSGLAPWRSPNLRALVMTGASKSATGSLICALSSGWRSSSSRIRAASSAAAACLNRLSVGAGRDGIGFGPRCWGLLLRRALLFEHGTELFERLDVEPLADHRELLRLEIPHYVDQHRLAVGVQDRHDHPFDGFFAAELGVNAHILVLLLHGHHPFPP